MKKPTAVAALQAELAAAKSKLAQVEAEAVVTRSITLSRALSDALAADAARLGVSVNKRIGALLVAGIGRDS